MFAKADHSDGVSQEQAHLDSPTSESATSCWISLPLWAFEVNVQFEFDCNSATSLFNSNSEDVEIASMDGSVE